LNERSRPFAEADQGISTKGVLGAINQRFPFEVIRHPRAARAKLELRGKKKEVPSTGYSGR
jgi:hypothetical protein